jgi:hypothetical protein
MYYTINIFFLCQQIWRICTLFCSTEYQALMLSSHPCNLHRKSIYLPHRVRLRDRNVTFLCTRSCTSVGTYLKCRDRCFSLRVPIFLHQERRGASMLCMIFANFYMYQNVLIFFLIFREYANKTLKGHLRLKKFVFLYKM